jgi:outer membrane protein assembly factor BamA
LDGGNIWNLELDQSRPEGLFTKKFYEQIALGGGFGLRFDASFFIFRLDLAYPLRNPFEDEFGRHWTLYSLSDFDYRKINYNIAIGYPF